VIEMGGWHCQPKFRLREPSPLVVWLSVVTGRTKWRRLTFPDLTLLNGDPAAVPVLLELLADPDPAIRADAAEGLGRVGPAAVSAVPALLAAVQDEDGRVRCEAATAASLIDLELALGDERFSAALSGQRFWARD
jgi:hypothetical protein